MGQRNLFDKYGINEKLALKPSDFRILNEQIEQDIRGFEVVDQYETVMCQLNEYYKQSRAEFQLAECMIVKDLYEETKELLESLGYVIETFIEYGESLLYIVVDIEAYQKKR